MRVTDRLADLAGKADRGEPFGRREAERVLAEPDLVSVGSMGEAARRRGSADTVTFGRMREIAADGAGDPGGAGEVRVVGRPASLDEACRRVRAAVALSGTIPVTAFSLADLLEICGMDAAALGDAARAIRAAGAESVAEVPIDRFASTETAIAAVRAVRDAGLHAWRWTVDRADAGSRLDLIMRAADMQAVTGAARAFAPLRRLDPPDLPSTGYDDVRTVAVARLVCTTIPGIQVDWPLYGPKLAQVAIAFGANDIDGIAADDLPALGPRRAPVEDIARHIRAASGVPVERTGRYEPRS